MAMALADSCSEVHCCNGVHCCSEVHGSDYSICMNNNDDHGSDLEMMAAGADCTIWGLPLLQPGCAPKANRDGH